METAGRCARVRLPPGEEGSMVRQRSGRPDAATSRRRFVWGAAAGTVGVLAAACGGPTPGTQPARRSVHVVKTTDAADWIETRLQEDIDGIKKKNPTLQITLELHGAWTDTYFPQVIAVAAIGQLVDAVWYPPRHRSHIA